MTTLGWRKPFCKRGHPAAARTKSRNCVECSREDSALWHRAHPEVGRRASSKWKKANREAVNVGMRKRYAANPKKTLAQVAKWQAANPEKKLAANHLRRARQAHRTPLWADLEKIQIVFRVARQMSRELRVRMSVDHVVPLRGEFVSGLHVHENLRIIPLVENCRKTNSYQCA